MLQSIAADPEAFATTLLVLMLDRYGDDEVGRAGVDILKWHPGTLRVALDELAGGEAPESNFAKLMAAITLLTSDVLTDVDTFARFCCTINGDPLNPRILQVPSSEDMLWALSEAHLLDEVGNRDEPLSQEVRHYMGAVLEADGVVDPPDLLRLAILPVSGGMDVPGRPDLAGEVRLAAGTRSQEILEDLHERVRKLFGQIAALDLRHGNVRSVLDRVTPQLK
jgi:hypothetical protein